MSKLRLAVIGVGHLGQIHTRLLGQVDTVELVGVVDPIESARMAASAELNVPAYATPAPLIGQIDAAIVAVPSRLHHGIAIDLLRHDIHVFVEKPMTLNVGDADELIAEAAARRLVLQVGHVERFNPALAAASPHLRKPIYIDAARTGPYTCRSTDIGVVLDLMIHDIDVTLSLADDELVSVQALGAAVIGPNEDWAQARLIFASGCVANLFASRVDWQARRSMRVVCYGCIADIDFGAHQARLIPTDHRLLDHDFDIASLEPAERARFKDRVLTDYLPVKELPVAQSNPLLEEQREFVAAIQGRKAVRVSGSSGRQALDVAERILAEISAHRWEGSAKGAVGPRFETRTSVLRGPHWRQPATRRKAG
jgi:predicted dehydrogenase